MCGIVGIWNLNKIPLDKTELNQFTDSLAHRGPDGRGIYVDEKASLGFGHRRLSILDISENGHQPMSYANGLYHITFNGEIYNFLELREELKGYGYSFVTDTDTEVILAAYDKWGADCQARFNGMWAFAIWNSADKELFISRDRFGVKPLFYFYDGKRFIFASELKAFFNLNNFNAEINYENFTRNIINPNALQGTEESLLTGIKELPAGRCLTLKPGYSPVVNQWWAIYKNIEDNLNSYAEQTLKFKEIFLDACRIRMRSDVPIGTSLSGGLDSSSVLCSIKHIVSGSGNNLRQANDWQKAFIAVYPGTVQDEKKYAEMVIRYTGAKPVFVDVKEDDVISNISAAMYAAEDVYDVHIGPWLIYRSQRQNGVKVSLDGHGGDELLAGYIKTNDSFSSVNMSEAILSVMPTFVLKKLFHYIYSHNSGNMQPIVNRMKWFKFIPAPLRKEFNPEEEKFLEGKDSLFNTLYRQMYFDTLPAILRNFDRCSMAHGVEVRCPFLDWRLVSYAFSLPPESKMNRNYNKLILRDSMRDILPDKIRTRKKKLGFSNPNFEWIKGKLKPFILDNVNSADFLQSDIWHGNLIRDVVETEYRKGDKCDFHVINNVWGNICAIQMQRVFKKNVNR